MIFVASSIAQKNGGSFYLVDDTAVRGGFQARPDTLSRDSIDAANRKAGMLVFTASDSKIWVLNSDLLTWSNLNQTINNVTSQQAGLMSAADKASHDVLVASAVTSATANAPIVSSGGKTPIFSIPASTSATDGYLRASDWQIFNSKGSGNGTVLSVGAQSPITSTGGTNPTIAIPQASATVNGYLSSSDWNIFNGKANTSSAVVSCNATPPLVSSGGLNPTLSLPAATSASDGYLRYSDWIVFNNKGNGTVQSVQTAVGTPLSSSGGVNPTISLTAASSATNGYLRATDWQVFNSKGNGNVNSVLAAAPFVVGGTATDPSISMPAATTTAHGYMTNADKSKLDSIAANANNYTHPSGDGNLHVPATGAANAGRVLTVGAGGAGDIQWLVPSGGVTSVNGQTGAVTLNSTNITGLSTTSDVQHRSLGVNTPASGVAGEIRATDNITGYYSSDRQFKENISVLPNALARTLQLNGVEFDWTQAYMDKYGGADGYFIRQHDVGLIAQEVQAVLPEVVGIRPDGSLALKYDRLVALLVEAVKDLSREVDILKAR